MSVRDNWGSKEIVGHTAINDSDPLVRLVAESIHRNESIHRHHDHDANTCTYCALVATRAVEVLRPALLGEGARLAVRQ